MKIFLKYIFNLIVQIFYVFIPRRVCNAIAERIKYLDILARKKLDRTPMINGRIIDSLEKVPNNETALILRLIDSFNFAKKTQLKMPNVYLPSHEWDNILVTEWHRYYDGLYKKDISGIAAFLRNFFRNEGLTGFWGGAKMFENFYNNNDSSVIRREQMMKKQFEIWRTFFPDISLDELDAPRIGNPWGYNFAGRLLFEPVFEYHFHANYCKELLCEIENPVVLEIGGGFGGLAFFLIKQRKSIKYIGLDLPENILLQAYYLSCAFPDAKVLTYNGNFSRLDQEIINSYDIILLPNFVMPNIESSIADLIINVRSLSEMSLETITEYIHQIDRIGRLFFFHENIFATRRDGLWGIPSSKFPMLDNFRLIASSESRWPKYNRKSLYPCQENLYIHRRAIKASL